MAMHPHGSCASSKGSLHRVQVLWNLTNFKLWGKFLHVYAN